MHRVQCTLPLAALMLVGCQNQPNTFSNPFLAPDKVPPPSTRVLAPGTAQPYYPGDPPPAVGGSAPSYAPTYAPTPATSPAPQANLQYWDPADGQVTAGDVVGVPADPGRLRFAAAPALVAESPTPPNLQLAAAEPTMHPLVGPVTPVNSVLPTPRDASAFQANAGLQTADYSRPPQRVEIREIHPAEYQQPPINAGRSVAQLGGDGFRPQGSTRRQTSIDETIRPPVTEDRPQIDSFGMSDQYQWLRGQLERSSTTGEWRIRYQRADQQPDQLGGSVIIANPEVLGNLQPGDFVVLRGQLHNLHYPNGTTVPAYRLTVVQRQQR